MRMVCHDGGRLTDAEIPTVGRLNICTARRSDQLDLHAGRNVLSPLAVYENFQSCRGESMYNVARAVGVTYDYEGSQTE